MNTRKFILLLLLISGFGFAYIKQAKIKRYIAEQRYHNYFVKMGIMKKCYRSAEINTIFAEEGFDYSNTDQEITRESLKKITTTTNKNTPTIPNITHHIYFTSDTNPIKPSEFYLEKMKANYNKLNHLGSWQHFIWTNNSKLFPKELLELDGVKIKAVKEFQENALYQYLLEIIDNGKNNRAYFSEASDILRDLALQKFGGIYTDMDYEIYDAVSLSGLMHKFDFIGGREWDWRASYYGTAFMASKPNHPVINEILRRLTIYNLDLDNSSVSSCFKYACSFSSNIYMKAPPLLTVSYFIKNNIEGNNDIILPAWMVFNVNFARQKNGECNAVVDGNQFIKKSQNLEVIISNFKKNYSSSESKFPRDDIYYNMNTKNRNNFPIIGADMFCGTWTVGLKDRKYYYWNWPFSLFMAAYED